MSGIFSFFWSFLIEFSRLTQENKKKAKKKFREKGNDKENTIFNTSLHNLIYKYKNI